MYRHPDRSQPGGDRVRGREPARLQRRLRPTETKPTSVENFTVYLLSIRGNEPQSQRITVRRVPLTSDFAIRGGDDDDDDDGVEDFIDKRADFVAAIVIYDESTEATSDYAPYRLTVNGVVQPGGGM